MKAGYAYPLRLRADDAGFMARVSLAQPMGPPLPLVSQAVLAEGSMRWAQHGAGEPGGVAGILPPRTLLREPLRVRNDWHGPRAKKMLDGEGRPALPAEWRGPKRHKAQRGPKGPQRKKWKTWKAKGEDRQGVRGGRAQAEKARLQFPLRQLNGPQSAARTPPLTVGGAGAGCTIGTPHRTPHSTPHGTPSLADLCVNPYGTMAGAINLESADRRAEGQGESSEGSPGGSSSSGPASSSSEGRAGAGADTLPSWKLADGFGATPPATYPGRGVYEADSFMRTRIEEQEVQLNHLEEENLTLKEKLFLVQQELEEMRRRTLGMLPVTEGGAAVGEAEGDNSAIWACMSTA